MGTKHENAEVIKQWVDGAVIECQSPTTDKWFEAPMASDLGIGDNYLLPSPIHPDYAYFKTWRVKK